jgi:hypothetical protein
MSCERTRAALIEVALGADPDGEVRAHLEACPACQGELQARRGVLSRIDGELRSALAAAPSPELLPRVRERLAEDAARKGWALRRWLPAAVGALALVVAVWQWPATPSPPRSPEARLGPPRREPPSTASTAAPQAPLPAEAAPPLPSSAAPPRRAVAALRHGGPAEPEVLVPRDGELALRRFVGLLRSEPEQGQALLRAEGGLEPLPDLAIVPLEVKPLSAEP